MRRMLFVVALSLVATLFPMTGRAHAVGGQSPDFNGDGAADLAIGVPRATVAGMDDAGAVTVLYGKPATGLQAGLPDDQRWTQTSGGIEGDPETGDQFGLAVTAGDFDGDGFSDLAIGVPTDDIHIALGGGKVNVIYGSATGLTAAGNQLWSQELLGVEGEPRSGENFGGALAAGDFNGDGFADLAIGVPGEVVGDFTGAGGVNVLYGSADGLQFVAPVDQLWTRQDLEGDADSGDAFGAALAVGDLDGDGFADLAIGAPGQSVGGGAGAGAGHVMYGSAAGLQIDGAQLWTQNSAGVASTAKAGEAFASALAVGDFDGDGREDLGIGVPGNAVSQQPGAGLVHVLYGGASGLQVDDPKDQAWDQNGDSVKDSSEANDAFGSALAAADFDSNGMDDLAIGVPGETLDSEASAGFANVLYGAAAGLQATGPNDEKWSQNKKDVEETSEAGDLFGATLSAADFDGDGFPDLAIGSPGENVQGSTGAGAVNVVHGSADGLQADSPLDQLWHAGSPSVRGQPEANDGFGSALSGIA